MHRVTLTISSTSLIDNKIHLRGTYVVQYVCSVGTLGGLPIMHHVGYKVVGRVLFCDLAFLRQVLSEVHVTGGGTTD